jgi:fibro-slime domain-containing protein
MQNMTLISTKKTIKLAKKLLSYQLVILMLVAIFAPISAIFAAEPLIISNITITKTDKTATISWMTNRPAEGLIEYGIAQNDYNRTIKIPVKQDKNTVTLTGLLPKTVYHVKITASDGSIEVSSFEQVFETNKQFDNQAPKISDVRVVYTTGTTATIQWLTDEPANSEVEYGTKDTYGSKKTDSKRVGIHDITLSGLNPATTYHFKVRSKDADNNVSVWYDMTFRTDITNRADNDQLIIYDILPTSENNVNVTENSAVISWRTNKLSDGFVKYGVSTTSLNKKSYTTLPRDFQKSVTLTGLTSGTTYYFEIEVLDVFSKKAKAVGYSFTTKSTSSENQQTNNNTDEYSGGSGVLGVKIANIDFEKDFGFYGMYYNLTTERSDVEIYKGKEISNPIVAGNNGWYQQKYFSFSRIDANINFGRNFFPIDEGKPGDPYHFAVHWRAAFEAPSNDTYNYSVSCDDDCWVYIDGKLLTDFNGVHAAKTEKKDFQLTAGWHKLEIWYAERSRYGSVFSFIPDPRLIFHPLPEGYEIEDIFNSKSNTDSGVGGEDTGVIVPQVLGVKTENTNTSKYVCNPNLGYSKFIALYKTANTPDVWAILENGQKHYITSPQAFAKYQCNWSEVKIVSQSVLDRYPNAKLVRTPSQSTIYHLFQRAETKWLKITLPSPTVFVSYENNYWGNVARVDALDIEAYPSAKLIKTKNSTNVYLLEGSNRRLIKSAEVFEAKNFEWAEVVELNQTHFDYYEDGPVLTN